MLFRRRVPWGIFVAVTIDFFCGICYNTIVLYCIPGNRGMITRRKIQYEQRKDPQDGRNRRSDRSSNRRISSDDGNFRRTVQHHVCSYPDSSRRGTIRLGDRRLARSGVRRDGAFHRRRERIFGNQRTRDDYHSSGQGRGGWSCSGTYLQRSREEEPLGCDNMRGCGSSDR